MKLDLNVPIKNLDGENIADITIGKQIANALVSVSKGDALKYYDWAVKLNKGEAIEVDRTDLNKIKEFVENSEVFTILLKAQALEVISTVKE